MRFVGLSHLLAAIATLTTLAGCATDAAIALKSMGSFHVGGREVTITGKPVSGALIAAVGIAGVTVVRPHVGGIVILGIALATVLRKRQGATRFGMLFGVGALVVAVNSVTRNRQISLEAQSERPTCRSADVTFRLPPERDTN